MSFTLLHYDQAVQDLAEQMRGCQVYVIPALALDHAVELAEQLEALTYFGHSPIGVVVIRDDMETVMATLLLNDLLLGSWMGLPSVMTVAKTASNKATLEEYFRVTIGEEQDILIFEYADKDQKFYFPTLFVDATDLVDPIAAASIRSSAEHWYRVGEEPP